MRKLKMETAQLHFKGELMNEYKPDYWQISHFLQNVAEYVLYIPFTPIPVNS